MVGSATGRADPAGARRGASVRRRLLRVRFWGVAPGQKRLPCPAGLIRAQLDPRSLSWRPGHDGVVGFPRLASPLCGPGAVPCAPRGSCCPGRVFAGSSAPTFWVLGLNPCDPQAPHPWPWLPLALVRNCHRASDAFTRTTRGDLFLRSQR